MNRKHDTKFFLDIVQRLRQIRPDLAMSSDFIVGYPGETEEDFMNTMNLAKEVGFTLSYSFKYSPRIGTPGALMENQIPEEVKTERLSRLQDLLFTQQKAFNEGYVGKVMPVLLDRKGKKESQLLGKTPYAQSVYVEAPERLYGHCVEVKIEKASSNSLTGSVVTVEG